MKEVEKVKEVEKLEKLLLPNLPNFPNLPNLPISVHISDRAPPQLSSFLGLAEVNM
ncbi:MAG: hypothetical protein U7123_21295 [Potamolinea sp.]